MTNSSYSAVIIARNEEMCIRKTIQSLLNQTVPPHRVVVVGDDSTDKTADICREMGVEVITLSRRKGEERNYSHTLTEIRNVGLRKIWDDQVDWVYSGDSDIILPKAYCETIMIHADQCGAYVAAGTEKEKLDQLPMEGCQMIRLTWLRAYDVRLKWESVYICMRAVAAGYYTMVRHGDNYSTITAQRPSGTYSGVARMYARGMLARKMGMSVLYLLWKTVTVGRIYGTRGAWLFFKGWLAAKVEVPDDVRSVYRRMLYDNIKTRLFGRLGRKSNMFRMHDGNMVCGPGGSN